MVVRPAVIKTTPTIRRSIAAAREDLATLLTKANSEFFDYDLEPEARAHGSCAGSFWSTYLLGAHIGLSEHMTYIFDDGLHVIELKGEEAPHTWHSYHGMPITALVAHPLLDRGEKIVRISTFRPDDPADAAGIGTWIELDCETVPLFPDIFKS